MKKFDNFKVIIFFFQNSLLNNTDISTPWNLNDLGCQGTCLLNDLTKIWSDVLPDDWDKECNL